MVRIEATVMFIISKPTPTCGFPSLKREGPGEGLFVIKK
jgi:hypothetical protein